MWELGLTSATRYLNWKEHRWGTEEGALLELRYEFSRAGLARSSDMEIKGRILLFYFVPFRSILYVTVVAAAVSHTEAVVVLPLSLKTPSLSQVLERVRRWAFWNEDEAGGKCHSLLSDQARLEYTSNT